MNRYEHDPICLQLFLPCSPVCSSVGPAWPLTAYSDILQVDHLLVQFHPFDDGSRGSHHAWAPTTICLVPFCETEIVLVGDTNIKRATPIVAGRWGLFAVLIAFSGAPIQTRVNVALASMCRRQRRTDASHPVAELFELSVCVCMCVCVTSEQM